MKKLILSWSLAAGTMPLMADVAAGMVLADYTKPDHGWVAQNHATNGVTTAKGFSVESFADDPWLVCPSVAYPVAPPGTRMLAVTLTTEPTTDARDWQLFTAGSAWGFCEAHSVRLAHVEQNPPYTHFVGELPVADLPRGKGRLRLDPPGHEGAWTVKSLTVDFAIPIWEQRPQPPPPLVIPAATPLVLAGKNWELRHDPKRLGAFRYLGCGKLVENHPAEPFVYLDKAGKVCQLDWSQVTMTAEAPSRAHPGTLVTKATTTDADGRTWTLTRRFSSVEEGQSLTIYTHLLCRDPGCVVPPSVPMLHVPFLTLFVERGSAGHKRQALLAGVEYLDDEPSSSQAEIRTHESDRRIPAEYRMSAPLAVFTDDTSWLGFRWGRLAVDAPFGRKPGPAPFATVFDSPDRMFRSGGHLLAFWAPNVGPARRESSLAIERAVPLQFGQTRHEITIRAGVGADVATALETLVPPKTYALPPVDKIDPVDSLELLSLGWLDSSIRDGLKLRHAVAANFRPGKIGDGPVLMDYLAAALARRAPARTELPARLRRTAGEILASLTTDQIDNATVSHIRRPAPPLVSGNVTNRLNRAAGQLQTLTRSLASGKQIYHAPPPEKGRPDLGATLGREFCNGFAAIPADTMLGCATWSGNEQLIEQTLAIVDKFTALYHGTVPRGAQPWEMPLHTPDLMASAHLTRVYTLAYLLKPDPAYLREARHWAYTGLSMIYLQPPPFAFADGVDPVGTYATCAVMGATNWTRPNWIGRPVQWCGLVYAAALWDLARIDKQDGAFWRQLASGITTSGVRQTHPRGDGDKVGLLPDSFNLEKQRRHPCPINPGTVEENLAEYLDLPFYAVRAWPKGGNDPRPSLFHLAGSAQVLPAKAGVRRCRIDAWPETESRALLTRFAAPPQAVTLEGRPLAFSYYAPRRALIIVLPPKAQGELCVKE